MNVLHAIIQHCETLMRTQSGTEYLRGEISKIRDLAREGLAQTQIVTPEPIASQTDVERHLDADETAE